eukprot:861834-Karenia_brevis.AAC.1
MVDSGSAPGHCLMRYATPIPSSNVISFNAAISVRRKGGQCDDISFNAASQPCEKDLFSGLASQPCEKDLFSGASQPCEKGLSALRNILAVTASGATVASDAHDFPVAARDQLQCSHLSWREGWALSARGASAR